MFKSKFKVGDSIRGYYNDGTNFSNKYIEGIVRHIGIMNDTGQEDSIWSDWDGEATSWSYFKEQSSRIELLKPHNEWMGKKR